MTTEDSLKAVAAAVRQSETKPSPPNIANLLDNVSKLLDELRQQNEEIRRRLTLIQRTLGTDL